MEGERLGNTRPPARLRTRPSPPAAPVQASTTGAGVGETTLSPDLFHSSRFSACVQPRHRCEHFSQERLSPSLHSGSRFIANGTRTDGSRDREPIAATGSALYLRLVCNVHTALGLAS